MKRDAKLFRERFKRWLNGESYWDMRAEAEKRTADPREQYDYVGYLNKYGTLDPTDTESGHYTDEFKLPGHPTFSNESIYSNPQIPGGRWNGNVFEHSDWTIRHSDYTNDYLKFADPDITATYKGGVVLPEVVVKGSKKQPKYDDGKDKVGPTYNEGTRRWTNVNGQTLVPGKGYYSRAANKYVLYNTDGTVTKFSPEEYVSKKANDVVSIRKGVDKKYKIPFIKEKEINLTNAGKYMTGATLSTNQLDSIAKYGKMAGIPMKEALGLVAKESTFGHGNTRGLGWEYGDKKDGKWFSVRTKDNAWSPSLLTSNWHYYDSNPYAEYLNATNKITDELLEKEAAARKKKSIDRFDIGRTSFLKNESNFNMLEHPLLNAFKYHKSGNYNTGENHLKKVLDRGRLLLRVPEIQRWMRTSEYAYDEGKDSKQIYLTTLGDDVYYTTDPQGEGERLSVLNKPGDNPQYWTYIDSDGNTYNPTVSSSNLDEIRLGEAGSFVDNIIALSNKHYFNPVLGSVARFKSSWENDTNPMKALYNSPFMMANPYTRAIKGVGDLALEDGIRKTIYAWNRGDSDSFFKSLGGDMLSASMLGEGLYNGSVDFYKKSLPILNVFENQLKNAYNLHKINRLYNTNIKKGLSEQSKNLLLNDAMFNDLYKLNPIEAVEYGLEPNSLGWFGRVKYSKNPNVFNTESSIPNLFDDRILYGKEWNLNDLKYFTEGAESRVYLNPKDPNFVYKTLVPMGANYQSGENVWLYYNRLNNEILKRNIDSDIIVPLQNAGFYRNGKLKLPMMKLKKIIGKHAQYFPGTPEWDLEIDLLRLTIEANGGSVRMYPGDFKDIESFTVNGKTFGDIHSGNYMWDENGNLKFIDISPNFNKGKDAYKIK